ncbi:hypothetical protein MKQ70_35675 [Chitinophaga sedimenti]|uniref:hypothetical protein n=1 Tax=Chitinophaga sedimenti TaxID=2033606 RepID=UPI002004A76F|nr:hypothetical protein [Chitinophaga sedimenti]MCK7559983.1 hypothetical protein [Chitinophaga sedimenti]
MDVKSVFVQKEEVSGDFSIIYNTLNKDTSNSELEAVQHIYRQLRGADAPDDETARGIIDKLFFSDKRYDLGDVGRYKINRKLGLPTPLDMKVLTKDDIISIIKYRYNSPTVRPRSTISITCLTAGYVRGRTAVRSVWCGPGPYGAYHP